MNPLRSKGASFRFQSFKKTRIPQKKHKKMNRIFICATLATLTSAEYFGWTPLTDVEVSLEQEVVATIALKIPEKQMESLPEISLRLESGFRGLPKLFGCRRAQRPRISSDESVQAVLSWCAENEMSCKQIGTGDLVRMTVAVRRSPMS